VTEPKRRRGRPVTTGETKVRSVRIAAVWDQAAAIAEQRGETMTDVVKRLLENYVRRHRAS
jgi:hypothetical protein